MSVLGSIGIEAVGVAADKIGGLFGSLRSMFTGKEVITSEDMGKIETLLSTLEGKVIDLKSKVVDAQQNVIVAEAQGGSWLQRNWRPVTMLTFVSIVANNYIVYPYCKEIFDWGVKLETPPELWGLIKIGLGGYIVGRSVEKSVKSWRAGGNG